MSAKNRNGKTMKSKLIDAKDLGAAGRVIASSTADRINLFAAQSSFYICISSIPLAVLLLSLSRLANPDLTGEVASLLRSALPEGSREFFDSVSSEIASKTDTPLISTAAASTLWASSRGLFSVIRGVSEVYGKRVGGSVASRVLMTVVYTAVFVVTLCASLVLLVFGKYVRTAAESSVSALPMFIRYK